MARRRKVDVLPDEAMARDGALNVDALPEQERRVYEYKKELYEQLDAAAKAHSFWLPRDVIFKYGLALPIPHEQQYNLIKYHIEGKHVICLAGRRGGKTTAAAMLAVGSMVTGRHVVYASPRESQSNAFWLKCKKFLDNAIRASVVRKLSAFGREVTEEERELFTRIYFNPTKHIIAQAPEDPDVGIITCITAYDPDVMRSNDADLLILDEAQMLQQETFTEVGLPILMDRNGHVVIIFTYPGPEPARNQRPGEQYFFLRLYRRVVAYKERGVEGVRDAQEADAEDGVLERDDTPSILTLDDFSDWEAIHFTSFANPYISREAVERMRVTMTQENFAREVLGQEVDEEQARRALWSTQMIENARVSTIPSDFRIERYYIGVDPAVKGGTTGIVVVAAARDMKRKQAHYYVLRDASIQGPPDVWVASVAATYNDFASRGNVLLVIEENQGGELVRTLLQMANPSMKIAMVRAVRGKVDRAAPIALMYTRGIVHHVGVLQQLEEEMTTWTPSNSGSRGRGQSPNRIDALVWAVKYASSQTSVSGVNVFRLGAIKSSGEA